MKGLELFASSNVSNQLEHFLGYHQSGLIFNWSEERIRPATTKYLLTSKLRSPQHPVSKCNVCKLLVVLVVDLEKGFWHLWYHRQKKSEFFMSVSSS